MRVIVWLLAVAGFVGWASLATRDKLIDFDKAIINWTQGFESDTLTSVMKVITFIGSSKGMIIVTLLAAIILFIFLGHRRELILLVVSVGGVAVLNEGLKMIYQRERPTLHRIIEETGFSFPSGHSMASFTLYAMLTYLLWRHIRSGRGRTIVLVVAAVVILMIGMSRIYLGVHYPSDVLGGYLISACWIALCIAVYRRTRGVRH